MSKLSNDTVKYSSLITILNMCRGKLWTLEQIEGKIRDEIQLLSIKLCLLTVS